MKVINPRIANTDTYTDTNTDTNTHPTDKRLHGVGPVDAVQAVHAQHRPLLLQHLTRSVSGGGRECNRKRCIEERIC